MTNSGLFLKTYKQNRFNTNVHLTEEQQSICDNIWNLSTTGADNSRKLSILYTLVDMFTNKEKKKFTHYGLFNGPSAGIYISWEEMIPRLKELEQLPKYGIPIFKGYYDYETAKEAIEKQLGKDYIVSDSIKQLQIIASGVNIKEEDLTPTELSLRPKTSFATITAKEVQKGKMVQLGRIPQITPTQTKNKTICFPETFNREIHFLQTTKEQNATTYKEIYSLLTKISTQKIPGFKITWEIIKNQNIPCTKQFTDCKDFSTDCRCTIIASMPLISLRLSQYKYLVHNKFTLDPATLLNYGFIKELYLNGWHQTDLPEPLNSITDYFTEILDTELHLGITTVPPHYGNDIIDPSRHIIKIKAENFDLDFPIWEEHTELTDKSTPKMNEQQHYERYRAYIIGRNLNWENTDKTNFKLYAESQVTKIYISRQIEEFGPEYRPFDIFHPRPNTINIYKKLQTKLPEDNGSTSSKEIEMKKEIPDIM